MGFYVGIDLGTTNSTVSVIQTSEYEDNPLEALDTRPIYQFDARLKEQMGEVCLPSALYFDIENSKVYTGLYAKAMYASGDHPLQTVCSIKTRLSGMSQVVVPGIRDSNCTETFSMVECDAFFIRTILQSLKAQFPSEDVAREAVVTVPAAFSDDERVATQNAVLLGGFRSCRILDEPTAALISYLNSDIADEDLAEKEETCRLVYDIGGGTLDVCVAQAKINDDGDYNVNVLGLSERMNLGGDDFDRMLAASFLMEFEQSTAPIESYSLEDQSRIIARIISNAEDYKIKLSTQVLGTEHRRLSRLRPIRISFNLINGMHIEGQTLSKDKFDDLCAVFTNPASGLLLKPVRSALKRAKIKPEDIDEVILTGGMSSLYSIPKVLQEHFGGREPSFVEDTRTAVSRGAALYHWSLDENNYCEGVKRLSHISERMAGNVYLRRGNEFQMLIDGNMPETSGDFFLKVTDSYMTHLPLFLYSGSLEEEGADKLTALSGHRLRLQHAYNEGDDIRLHWTIDENKMITIALQEQGYAPLSISRQPEPSQYDLVQRYTVNGG